MLDSVKNILEYQKLSNYIEEINIYYDTDSY